MSIRLLRRGVVAVLLAAMLLTVASVAVAAEEGTPSGHVTPPYGPATGGTHVDITGVGFTGATAVTFGGTAATSFTVASDTHIGAVTPAHDVGAAPVVVTKADSTTVTVGGFFFTPPQTTTTLTITGINPTQGSTAGHTPVVISGTGFGPNTTVKFGGVAATDVHFFTGAILIARTPAHDAGTVNVVVANSATQSATLAQAYTYIAPAPAPAPTITRLEPNSGPASSLSAASTAMDDHHGQVVAIIGTGFQPNAAVTFDGLPVDHSTLVSSTLILTTPPAHAPGTVAVVVTNPDNQSATKSDAYTYVAPTPGAAPTIATIDPNTGPATPATGSNSDGGGTPRIVVKITGTGFQQGATVKFGDATSHDVGIISDSLLLTLAPPHAAGQVDVTVTNPDGQFATVTGGFTYVAPAPGAPPKITKVDPPTGSTSDHEMRFVTITGTGFAHGATVMFGTVAAGHAEVFGDTAIITTAPNQAPGTVDVTVTNPDGQHDTLAQAYTYVAPLTVATIAPNTGPAAGGTDVTITGAGFKDGATVRFDGLLATNVVVSGDGTSLTAKTPAHPAGQANVYVINPDHQGGGLSHAFTFTGDAPPTPVALTITDVDPGGGPVAGGFEVAVRGAGFTANTVVTFDTSPATFVRLVNSTVIIVRTPSHASGKVNVTVSDNGQTSTLTNGYSYISTPGSRPPGTDNGPTGGQPPPLPTNRHNPDGPTTTTTGLGGNGGNSPPANPVPTGR